MVHAYSVDWLLHLRYKVFLRPPLEEVVYQCHASFMLIALRVLGSGKKNRVYLSANKNEQKIVFLILFNNPFMYYNSTELDFIRTAKSLQTAKLDDW